jgi:hypothetical protein
MRSRKLTIGFFVAIVFCAANLYSYYRMPEYSTMDDGFVSFGWPFSIYAFGGFWTHTVIIWTGLIGNVFVALSASRILRRVFEKSLTRRSLWSSKTAAVTGGLESAPRDIRVIGSASLQSGSE